MAQVKLLVIEHGECIDVDHIIKTRVRTASGLLKKAKQLARKYITYFLFDWHRADVYIYDPHKKNEYDNGTPAEMLFWTPVELYNKGNYTAIINKVKDAQGVELKI
jgi:hypothetical protein